MDTNKRLRLQRILETVLIASITNLLRTDATPILNINEFSNITSPENVTAVNKSSSMDYSSSDPYLYEVYDACVIAKDMYTCAKYRALKYIHDMTSPFEETRDHGSLRRPEFKLWGSLRLIALLPHERSTQVESLFPESNPRSTDSVFMRLFRFTLRQVERFVRAYGLVINVPTGLSSGGSAEYVDTPRVIDEDILNGSLKEGKSVERSKVDINSINRLHN
jgi:hypothetical protein